MTQEKKQTAVDWLSEQTYNVFNELQRGNITMTDFRFKMLNFEQQAKAMEREQIEKTYDAGHDDGHDEANGDGSYYDTKEDYYERTYGKEASHE